VEREGANKIIASDDKPGKITPFPLSAPPTKNQPDSR
jgi:hypothetical protein